MSAKNTLIVATHNVHKLREIGQILPGWNIRGEDSGAEETADDFVGNARIKVRAIAPLHPGAWMMADDSGLEVAALGGAPGVRSARYADGDGDTPANKRIAAQEPFRHHGSSCALYLRDRPYRARRHGTRVGRALPRPYRRSVIRHGRLRIRPALRAGWI